MSYDAIIRALADLIISIDLSDDEVVDPTFASGAFEDVVVVFDSLPEGDRSRIVSVILGHAETERDPRRRQALLDFPENFGLLEDDVDQD